MQEQHSASIERGELINSSTTSCLLIDTLNKTDKDAEAGFHETKRLIETLGFDISCEFTQFRPYPDKRTFIGSGKCKEILEYTDANPTKLIIVGKNLSPSQNKFIENYFKVETWDRTRLILEIFSRHAKTYEAKLQVKLAYHKYQLPRLKGMWGHLDRESGAGLNKGMGEKQITVDKFLLTNKIAKLKNELKKIDNKRRVQKKSSRDFVKVSLIGYTNAGKSRLFNVMTGGSVPSDNVLFSTLDSKSGLVKFNHAPPVILSDTVGFIRNLPLDLVASFRSTLMYLNDSDLLLHVIDSNAEDIEGDIQTTHQVLSEIEATEIPCIKIFNKTDLPDEIDISVLKARYPNALFISCERQSTGQAVFERIKAYFGDDKIQADALIPYSETEIINDYYKYGMVREINYAEDGVHLKADITKIHLAKIRTPKSIL